MDTGTHAAIETRNGSFFDFENLDSNLGRISIFDIAHALSLINRFNGHTEEPYSVAQHCYVMSTVADNNFDLYALMDDAHEAYIGDMTSPLKRLFPEFKAFERRVRKTVLKAFNLFPSVGADQLLKELDLRVLAQERKDLMPHKVLHWEMLDNVIPCAFEAEPWGPKVAEQMFLRRFIELTDTERGKVVHRPMCDRAALEAYLNKE